MWKLSQGTRERWRRRRKKGHEEKSGIQEWIKWKREKEKRGVQREWKKGGDVEGIKKKNSAWKTRETKVENKTGWEKQIGRRANCWAAGCKNGGSLSLSLFSFVSTSIYKSRYGNGPKLAVLFLSRALLSCRYAVICPIVSLGRARELVSSWHKRTLCRLS